MTDAKKSCKDHKNNKNTKQIFFSLTIIKVLWRSLINIRILWCSLDLSWLFIGLLGILWQ